MDSSTSCDQRGDSQTCCQDLDCPRCTGNHMAVSTLRGPTIAGLIAKDAINRLPHITLDDDVAPLTYRSQFFGNFPFSTLDRRAFRDRDGIYRL